MDKESEDEAEWGQDKEHYIQLSKKYQFTTDLSVNEKKIEIVNETRLLGTILPSGLKWDKNTKEIDKKA